MFRTYIFYGLIALMMSGCSKPSIMWSKEGGNQQEFTRDNYECTIQTRTSWGGGGTGSMGAAMIISAQNEAERQANELYRMCMEAHGYTGTEVTDEFIKSQNERVAKMKQLQEDAKQNIKNEKIEHRRKFENQDSVLENLKFNGVGGNSIILDPVNNIMWANDGKIYPELNWDDAAIWLTNYNYAGYSGWRLPTPDELNWAYIYNDRFKNIQQSQYWSSVQGSTENYAKYFNMTDEHIGQFTKSYTLYVLPVRDLK